MEKRLRFFGLLLGIAMVVSSCLSDDDSEVTFYRDTGLTAFSLGTLTRTVHTTSSAGEDSTYTESITGSSYKFTIDQQRGLIYNLDSLPTGTRTSSVLCTASAKNGGTIVVNLRTSDGQLDSLVRYSNKDSLDFSKDLEFRVYNAAGTAYRRYVVDVRVHQEEADVFRWFQLATDETARFAEMKRVRLLSADGHTYLFGLLGAGDTDQRTVRYDLDDVVSRYGTGEGSYETYGSATIDNIVVKGGELLALDGERLWHTGTAADGTWTSWYDEGRNVSALRRLAGASSKEIYAFTSDGRLAVSTDDCLTWTEEALDNDKGLLPVENVSCTVRPLRTNPDMERVMLVGTVPGRDYAVVWMKIADTGAPGAGKWLLVANGTENAHALPATGCYSVASYDGGDVAIGADSDGSLRPIYMSKDGGITWHADDVYAWPSDASSTGAMGATVDSGSRLWAVFGGTGQLWRGRLNRMGWATAQ